MSNQVEVYREDLGLCIHGWKVCKACGDVIEESAASNGFKWFGYSCGKQHICTQRTHVQS